MKVIGRLSFGVGVLMTLFFPASAQTRQMIVRVQVADYPTLYQHIPFKGTSIEIVGAVPGESYDLLLKEEDLALVLNSGLKTEVVVEDLENQKREAIAFGFYCSYDSLVSIMRNWAISYPSICKLESIGQTYEGRWIYGVKISDNVQEDEDEPEVLLEAMHHSREWATPQAARYFADTILRNYTTNPQFQNFVNNHELWVFPIINVDGYVYDYPNQRYWRKNRQPYDTAIGCDPNRDYNGACNGSRMADWGALVNGSRSSHYPSDITFMGGYGAWGYEVNALSNFFKQRTFLAYISLHSYSELVLWPYGNGEVPPDNNIYVSLGQRMAQQMHRLSGGTYTPEPSSHLYPTNGGSIDWMYGWARHIGGFPCLSYVFEIGTAFYQNVGDLDAIQREVFKGAWYLFTRADSIAQVLKGTVPRPILGQMDSSASGTFLVHWTPIRPQYNHPEKWEMEEWSGLTTVLEDFESGSGRWVLVGSSLSTTRRHSGNYSISLGSGNNISNYAMTAYPYPVQPGDSLVYWIWYDTETNYDVVVTEVSLEGKEWIQLHNRYTGNSGDWVRKVYSLDPWAGKSVFIRFRYMTDDNTLRNGVYVDDVWPVPSFAQRRIVNSNILDTLYEVVVNEPGQYWYRVRGYNSTWGWGDFGPLEDIIVTGTGVADEPVKRIPSQLILLGPNPSTGGVYIHCTIGTSGNADLMVFDASGRAVRNLLSGKLPAGDYKLYWNGTDNQGRRLPAGVYFCRLSSDRTLTQRVILSR